MYPLGDNCNGRECDIICQTVYDETIRNSRIELE